MPVQSRGPLGTLFLVPIGRVMGVNIQIFPGFIREATLQALSQKCFPTFDDINPAMNRVQSPGPSVMMGGGWVSTSLLNTIHLYSTQLNSTRICSTCCLVKVSFFK